MVRLWIGVASALPYTDDVCRSVVTTLLGIASSDKLPPRIPMVAWDWLNKRPVLPPEYVALLPATVELAVQEIRRLRDVKLIVSYLHVVWSEWRKLRYQLGVSRTPRGEPIWCMCDDMKVMGRVIREELGGVGAAGYRTDLIQRLDYVLLQLDQGQGWMWVKEGYEKLRGELLEVDGEAMNILTGTSSVVTPSSSTDSHVRVQDVTLPSCAHFLFRARSCVYRPTLLPVLVCEFLSRLQVPFPSMHDS